MIAEEFERRFEDERENIFPLELASSMGGSFVDCACASEYCPHCNGSVDPTVKVTFPDGSEALVSNPRGAVFEPFVTVCRSG